MTVSSSSNEPIVMMEVGYIVECQVCHNHMVIPPTYAEWVDHPGFRHPAGSPRCKPKESIRV